MHLSMKHVLAALLLLSLVWAHATREVVAPSVRVLFDDPALEPYAREVAADAERALAILTELFGSAPPPVVVVLDLADDRPNGAALPLPRPHLVLRPRFSLSDQAGSLRGEDPLFLLLVHELTHLVQLGYTEVPEGGFWPPRLGLVGEGVAVVPPMWFLEGIAVWAESTYGDRGRLDDPLARGVLDTVALDGHWPSLTEAGVDTYGTWPGGNTRYLFGGAFVDYLVRHYGFEAVLATLRRYNSGFFLRPFSAAWRGVVGEDLEDAWEAWRLEVLSAAEARADGLVPPDTLTDSGGLTGTPALSPDGRRLAWTSWPPAVQVADLDLQASPETSPETSPEDATAPRLTNTRTLLAEVSPTSLAWLDERTLLYARVIRRPGSARGELFTLDVDSGVETQLTSGERAHAAQPSPDGCILYLRDLIEVGSELRRLCPGAIPETVWAAPPGERLLALAVGDGEQVAFSLWRAGRTDLALLDGEELTLLTEDAAEDLAPAWLDAGTLVFSSDRDEQGVFELYTLEMQGRALRRLTRSVGGAFAPSVGGGTDDRTVVHTVLGGDGYDLALLASTTGAGPALALETDPLAPDRRSPSEGDAYSVRDYQPLASLAPYGWLPTDARLDAGGVAAAVTIYGQDDSGRHGYDLTVGYDSALDGHLGGTVAALRYRYGGQGPIPDFLTPTPLELGVRVGVWPHSPHLEAVTETALGVEGNAALTLRFERWAGRASLRVGLLQLRSAGAWQPDARLGVSLSTQRSDLYGYRTRGQAVGLTGVLSATPTGLSTGAWLDASDYLPLTDLVALPGTLELSLRAGYRQSPPVPLVLDELAAVATVGYRQSVPVGYRYGDGLHSLERVSLEPQLRLWYDGGLGSGGDLGVFGDFLLGYAAPVSLGGTVGYAQGWWYRIGARVSF